MSVNNDELADEDNFNTSFISREVDSSTVGKIDLANGDAPSGPAVINVQREINLSKKVVSSQVLAAAAAVAINALSLEQRVVVSGSGGPVTLAGVLFGAGPFIDGQKVRVVGGDAVNFPTIQNHDAAGGVWLRDASITLELGEGVTLEYFQTFDRWVEETRNK